jgi:hypothetical protein
MTPIKISRVVAIIISITIISYGKGNECNISQVLDSLRDDVCLIQNKKTGECVCSVQDLRIRSTIFEQKVAADCVAIKNSMINDVLLYSFMKKENVSEPIVNQQAKNDYCEHYAEREVVKIEQEFFNNRPEMKGNAIVKDAVVKVIKSTDSVTINSLYRKAVVKTGFVDSLVYSVRKFRHKCPAIYQDSLKKMYPVKAVINGIWTLFIPVNDSMVEKISSKELKIKAAKEFYTQQILNADVDNYIQGNSVLPGKYKTTILVCVKPIKGGNGRDTGVYAYYEDIIKDFDLEYQKVKEVDTLTTRYGIVFLKKTGTTKIKYNEYREIVKNIYYRNIYKIRFTRDAERLYNQTLISTTVYDYTQKMRKEDFSGITEMEIMKYADSVGLQLPDTSKKDAWANRIAKSLLFTRNLNRWKSELLFNDNIINAF